MKIKRIVKVFILAGLACLVFAGCSYQQQQFAIKSTQVIAESDVLKKEYARVELLLRNMQEEHKVKTGEGFFSEEEWKKLLNVDATIDMSISKYNAIGALDISSINLSEIEFLWGLSVEGYRQGRDVIYAHWDEFPPSTQIYLNNFDMHAQNTSDLITELLNDPSNDNITQALSLISGILTIGVKMLGAIAVLL